MSVRVWIGPWVFEDRGRGEAYHSKASIYCTQGYANLYFPSNEDGTPASTWVVTAGRAEDWTSAEADAEIDDLFGGDLPVSINAVPDLRAFLRTRTVANVPANRRNQIIAVLDKYEIQHSDFTNSTPLWKVWQRVVSTLAEKDFNFAARFNF